MKQITRPKWTTVIDPIEYSAHEQFDSMVREANNDQEQFSMMDVGKVVGLLDAYEALRTELAEAERIMLAISQNDQTIDIIYAVHRWLKEKHMQSNDATWDELGSGFVENEPDHSEGG